MSLDALIVEDSPAIRLTLRQQLEARGHRVRAFGDAETAWLACQESVFALIILDWILPGMDGLALCRRIRALPWGATCVILVITSREEPGDLARILDAGATDYMPKSAGMAQLALRLTVAERQIADTQRRIDEERALRARNARLLGLAEHASDLVVVLDAGGAFLYVSPSHRRLLGYDPDQLMAMGPLSIVHPDDRANTEAVFAVALADPGGTPMGQARLRHADGSWRWLESVLTNRLDDPAIGGVIVTSRDVTGHVQTVEAHRASEARFRTTFEDAAIGMAVVHPDGHYVQVNPAFCAMLGYSEQELLAGTVELFTYPEDWPLSRAYMDQALEGHFAHARFEKRYLHKNGRPIWVQITSSLVRDEQEQPLYFVNQLQDITKQRQIEEARRASEERLRTVIANAPIILTAIDSEGVFTFSEGSALNSLGVRPGDRVGHSIFEIYRDRPEIQAVVRRALAGEPSTSVATVGDAVLESRWTPLRDAGGQVTGAISVVADITAQWQAEEARRTSEQLLQTVVRNAPVVLTAVDERGIVTFSSGQTLERIGREPQSTVGRSIFDLLADTPLARDFVRRALAGEACSGIIPLRGTMLETRYVPLHAADGRVNGAVGVSTDVTERWQAEEALRQSEERFRALIEHAGDLTCILERDGMVRYESPSYERLLGRTLADAQREKGVMHVIYPDDQEQVRAAVVKVAALPEGSSVRFEFRYRRVDGALRTFESIATNHLATPGIHGIVGYSRDITERLAAQEALRQSEASLRYLVQAAPIGVTINNYDGSIELPNTAFCDIFGYTQEELIGQQVNMLMAPDVRAEEEALYRELTAHRIHGQREWVVVRKNGERLTVLSTGLSVTWSDGRPRRIAFIVDITERKLEEQRLVQLAHHDRLTGLPNRTLLMLRLTQILALAQRQTDLVALLFLDLDGFKEINDTLGHDAGDLLLKAVAERLLECVRESDTVARLAGDEFVVLLPGIKSEANTASIARKIIDRIIRPLLLDGQTARVTASIGISLYPRDARDPSMLLKQADTAMYMAKRAGKNRYTFAAEAVKS